MIEHFILQQQQFVKFINIQLVFLTLHMHE